MKLNLITVFFAFVIPLMLGQTIRLGLVPLGPYVSPAFTHRDMQYVMDRCKRHFGCAALCFHKSTSIQGRSEKLFDVYMYGYVPDHDFREENTIWKYYQDHKQFTYHLLKTEGTSHSELVDLPMPLYQAEELCFSKPTCVGFTFSAFDDLKKFTLEVEHRLFLRWYSSYRVDEDTLFSVQFLSSIASSKSPVPGAAKLTYMTALRNDPNVKKAFVMPNIQINKVQLWDPTGFCCNEMEEPPIVEDVQALDTTIQRVPCSISKTEFQRKYESARQPVILLDCDKHWKAKATWHPKALHERFQNDTIFRAFEFFDKAELDLSSSERLRSWSSILEAKKEGSKFYVSQQIDPNDELLNDFTTAPPQFPSPEDSLMNDVDHVRSMHYPYYFIYMGEKDASSPLHMDFSSSDAWNCLFHGAKWWVLIPPSIQKPTDFRCTDDCSRSIKGDAWFATIAPNIQRFSFANNQRAHHVLQKPGETLYIPNEWMHTTLNIGPTVALSSGFLSEYNLKSFWLQLIARGNQTIKDQKRLYYTKFNRAQRAMVRHLGNITFIEAALMHT